MVRKGSRERLCLHYLKKWPNEEGNWCARQRSSERTKSRERWQTFCRPYRCVVWRQMRLERWENKVVEVCIPLRKPVPTL